MRIRLVAAAFAVASAVLMLPAPAAALTADQVVELAKGGVSDQIILAVIARDNVPFDLDADALVALKQQGVSDTIVMAMLKSGRGETAEAPITVIAPDVVIIGHGPDIPNTSYWDRLYWNPSYVIPFIPPLQAAPYAPYARIIRPRRGAR
jgi:hypothetical protein